MGAFFWTALKDRQSINLQTNSRPYGVLPYRFPNNSCNSIELNWNTALEAPSERAAGSFIFMSPKLNNTSFPLLMMKQILLVLSAPKDKDKDPER